MLSLEANIGKLDPRVRRTLDSLEHAFEQALAEKGFQAVTVQDITERAGVNRATFYAHFPDKYALLDHFIRQGFLREIEARMLNACHYTSQNLRSLIIAVCEFTRMSTAHCKTPQAQFESLLETQVKGVVYELLTRWLEQTETTVPADTAATAGSWAIYGLAARWNRGDHPKPVEKFADEVLPIVSANLQIAQPSA